LVDPEKMSGKKERTDNFFGKAEEDAVAAGLSRVIPAIHEEEVRTADDEN
jgi:hypothetical protein